MNVTNCRCYCKNLVDNNFPWSIPFFTTTERFLRDDWSIAIFDKSLYNDVNATRAVIGRCSCSIRVQIHG